MTAKRQSVTLAEKLYDLAQASQSIASAKNLRQLMDRVFEANTRILDYSNCAFALINTKINMLEVKGHRGYPPQFDDFPLPVGPGRGITAWVAYYNSPIIVPDVAKAPLYVEGVPGAQSEMAVPLEVAGKVIGVLDVQKAERGAFDETDLLLFTMLANYAAIALEHMRAGKALAHAHKDLERRTKHLEKLMDSSADAILSANRKGRINFFNGAAREMFGYSSRDFRKLQVEALYDISRQEIQRLVRRLMIRGKVKGYQTELIRKDGSVFPAVVALSVLRNSAGEVTGYLGVVHDHSQLSRIEGQLQRTIDDLRESNARLEQLTLTDSMSGLYNRRHFRKMLGEQYRKASRTGKSLVLMLLDFDKFKSFNDVYGNQAGDEIIEQMGELFHQVINPDKGMAFRYGGEEFAVLLYGASYESAARLAQDLVKGYPRLRVFKRLGIEQIAMSAGMARFHPVDNALSMSLLLKEADDAVLLAKKRGGGQVAAKEDLAPYLDAHMDRG